MNKQCCSCGELKLLEDFSKDKNNKDGYTYDCKKCRRAKDKKWRQDNPEKVKSKNLANKDYRKRYYHNPDNKRKYNLKRIERIFGLSEKDYERILLTQDGKCGICRREENSTRNKNLCVDHCHKTKKVRGLLCTNCNRSIGLLKDNVETLKAAIAYLENHNEQ